MKKILSVFIALFLLCCMAISSHASDNLDYGIPGKSDQTVNRKGYALGYCEAWEQPRWVAYRLTVDEALSQEAQRVNNFQEDPAIRTGSATPEDYRRSGYDRGHLAPAADMKWSQTAMSECFYMSNMSPQDGGCNSGIWNEIENTVRGFACADDSVFIYTGPIVTSRNPKTIGSNRVVVPDGYYKVIYAENAERMIAFTVPNRKCKGKPRDYATTVDNVEAVTGLDFFSTLPKQKQAELEASIDVHAWDWSKSQKRRKVPKTAAVSRAADNGKEYRPGNQMPVSSRKAAPVCEEWPDTGYWLNTNTRKRHNRDCDNYRKTRGYPCDKNTGTPCGRCGG